MRGGGRRFANEARLVGGKKFGADVVLVEPRCATHRLGGGPAVAREHRDAHAFLAKRRECFTRIVAHPVGEARERRGLPMDAALNERHEDRKAFLFHFGPGFPPGVGEFRGARFERAAVADAKTVFADAARKARSRDLFEFVGLGVRSVPMSEVFEAFRDGARERVFGLRLKGAEGREDGRRVGALREDPARHLRAAFGDGAGLVQEESLRASEVFQRLGVLPENPERSAAARPRHDGGRGGKPQGAGAGDDEDRNRVGEGVFERRARGVPDDEGEKRNPEDDGNEPERDRVGLARDRRLRRDGVFDERDDLAQGRVGPGVRHAEGDVARNEERARVDAVVLRLVDGERLARHAGFVDAPRAEDHDAVGRDALARAHDHVVAHAQGVDGDFDFDAAFASHGARGREVKKRLDGRSGARLRAALERFTQGRKREDHGRRLEVEVMESVGRLRGIVRHREKHGEAVDERGAAPRRKERFHAGVAVKKRDESLLEGLGMKKDDGERQKELQKRRDERRFVGAEPEGEAQPHHRTHAEDQKRKRKDERAQEAVAVVRVGFERERLGTHVCLGGLPGG